MSSQETTSSQRKAAVSRGRSGTAGAGSTPAGSQWRAVLRSAGCARGRRASRSHTRLAPPECMRQEGAYRRPTSRQAPAGPYIHQQQKGASTMFAYSTTHPVRCLVLAAMVLTLVGVCSAPLAFAGVSLNTIDPRATVTDDDCHLVVTGPIACTENERASLHVTVTQRDTGAVAKGHTRIICAGETQHWEFHARSTVMRPFRKGRQPLSLSVVPPCVGNRLMRISGWSISPWYGSKGTLTHQSDNASQATGTCKVGRVAAMRLWRAAGSWSDASAGTRLHRSAPGSGRCRKDCRPMSGGGQTQGVT